MSLALHLALLAFVSPQGTWDVTPPIIITARLNLDSPPAPSPPVPAPDSPVAKDTPPPAPKATQPAPMPVPQAEAEPAPTPQPAVTPAPGPAPMPPTTPAQTPPAMPAPATAGAVAAPSAPPSSGTQPPQEGGLPSPLDPTWYLARQVDSHPRAITSIRPPYPEAARRREQEGTLKLMVKINELGRVVDVEVVEASPPGAFEEVTLEAFRNARFHPALRQGRPVRYQAYMRVEFKLDNPGP